MARKFVVSSRLTTEDDSSRVVENNESSWGRWALALGKVAIAAAATTKVITSLFGALRDGVRAAIEQENAVVRLDAALSGLGDAAESTSKALQEQAEALQSTTRFGDEAIIQAQALLATLGVQADQLQLATQATVDLAAALGISLESAARNVGRTVGGFAGELGEVIPELKDLGVEALRSGAGITLLADRFGGQAQRNAASFGGAVAQLTNALGDLNEAFGETVTGGDEAAGSISNLAQNINVLTTQVSGQTQGVFDRIVASFADWAGVLATAAANALTFSRVGEGLADTAEDLEKATKGAVLSQEEFTKALRSELAVIKGVQTAEERLADFRRQAFEALGIQDQERLNIALEEQRITLELLEQAYRAGEISRAQFEQGQASTRLEIEALEATLRGTVTSVDDYKVSLESSSFAQDEFDSSVQNVTRSLGLNTDALIRNAEAQTVNNRAKQQDPDRDPLISTGAPSGGRFTVVRSKESTSPDIGFTINGVTFRNPSTRIG